MEITLSYTYPVFEMVQAEWKLGPPCRWDRKREQIMQTEAKVSFFLSVEG